LTVSSPSERAARAYVTHRMCSAARKVGGLIPLRVGHDGIDFKRVPAVANASSERRQIGMAEVTWTIGITRRALLTAAVAAGSGFASTALASPLSASDEAIDLVKRLTGRTPAESSRLRLLMPQSFPNGYTVPLTIEVDSPMTDFDHVSHVRVLAPRNPIIEVATFHFVPQRSEPRVSTRIRLAEPQYVVAVAGMNDDQLLMTKTWVDVASNGCK
jgi:sulfur-oxidizing protein SoxY